MKRSEPKATFTKRMMDWAARLDVRVRGLSVRKMRRKWASCSSTGRLTFDETVLDMPDELQDYVIVHELLHVQVPNHGRLWKSLMRAHLGNYELQEAKLKRLAGDGSARISH